MVSDNSITEYSRRSYDVYSITLSCTDFGILPKIFISDHDYSGPEEYTSQWNKLSSINSVPRAKHIKRHNFLIYIH